MAKARSARLEDKKPRN